MRVSPFRIVLVTLAASLVGALCGAVLGGLATATHPPPGLVLPRAFVFRFLLFAFSFGAVGGSILGAVLAPALSWILLRRVPLHRAIRGTALGVALGLTAGLFVPMDWALLLGLIGFVIAGGRLWWVSRSKLDSPEPAV
jgi:hypothetical protein